jgi:phosphate/sulfate permease
VPVSTPVSRVLFTSSMEPGTQAVTLIVLFMACGCWIYGNRIGSQVTVRKTERAAAGA